MRRLASLALLLLMFGGCVTDADTATGGEPGGSAGGPPAFGDTLIGALLGDVSGFIPNITSDAPSHEVGDLIYSGLVTRNKDLALVGDLAESWTFGDDCRTLTFKLRPNVKWHDGHPFTADDVIFTWQTMVHPKTPTAYGEDFEAIERGQVVDPLTVRFTYKQPYAKALQSWGMTILPKHRLESYVPGGKLREAGENWKNPVGTGPYKFLERQSGEKVVLVANRNYFLGSPHISRIVYRIIPSQATIFLELKARGVDMAQLTALQFKRQTDYPAFRKAYNKFEYAANRYTYFGLNLKDPRFADRRVRQAFAHAVNKKDLIDGVILGLGREATGPYKPGTWMYNPNVKRYPYDLTRARQLLAEAGWTTRNAEGLLVKDGKPFTFELLTNQGNEERKKVAEIIQASLRELGVGVEIRILEWATFLKEHVKKRRFDAIILGWGIGLDPDQYAIWHSSQSGPDQLNNVSYANPEVDRVLERGRTSCVDADRKKYYDRFQEVVAEDLPVIFLYFQDALPVVASRVRGVAPSPAGILYNFTEWYVPKPLQRYTAE